MKSVKRVALAAALSGLALLSMSQARTSNAPEPGPDFIIANGYEPSTLDPSLMSGNAEFRIFTALFEGLVVNDPRTSRAVPGVAESWSLSPDGLRITFRLRECAWSDGTPITARTVVDSWLRTLDPATGSEYAYMINMVVDGAEAYNYGEAPASGVGIRAVDDRTFEVRLISPMPYAVDMMAQPVFAILPMHVIRTRGSSWTQPRYFTGNGPFRLLSWKPQESLAAVPNDRYWDAGNVGLGEITFLPIEDSLTAYYKFKAGEIDWAHGVPPELMDEIRLRPDYRVSPQIATYYYIFNVTRKPFDDARVRKALAMALDRQTLVDQVTKGGQFPTTAMVPALDGYAPPPGNGFDPAQARKLLAEAGYPGGRGFPPVTLLYNTSEGHKKIAEWAQESWKRLLGISVSLQNMEWATFLDMRQDTHDFQIVRAGWIGDYLDPTTFLDMFVTGSGLNDGRYSSKEYDRLVRAASAMPAGPERMETLREAEDLLVRVDQAVIPLYHYVEQDLIDLESWDGWYPNPLGIHPWKFIRPRD